MISVKRFVRVVAGMVQSCTKIPVMHRASGIIAGVLNNRKTRKYWPLFCLGLLALIVLTTMSSGFHEKMSAHRKKCLMEINKLRTSNLTKTCALQNAALKVDYSKNARPWNFIFVNDEFKLLYCGIPKTAMTDWKRILLMLSGKTNFARLEDMEKSEVHGKLQTSHLTPLWSFDSDGIKMRLDTYFKFMFVRHPAERTVSAYETLLNGSDSAYYRDVMAQNVKSYYKKRSSSELTFNEFIGYLADNRKIGEFLDPLWRPQMNLCIPCQVHYDVIGKYETLEDDYNVVLDYISNAANGDKRLKSLVSRVHLPSVKRRSNKTVLSRFAQIPYDTLQKLNELYAADYSHFGYHHKLRENGTLSDYYSESNSPIGCA